ncbi:unnamed protein product [Ostreobium quekettii]|uniref:Uncharacterized protein n=1 Tax=Ostreobium quekettii TaxID=121088 RepID=A0A8S1J4X5_9CHLO|nr:unnamed protein product [Ostreobium quekettii]|eukprot:evm.model.scf_2252.2 EVM.evm.TU.scf_2252.2   scf_2252:13994-21183(+)
MGVGMKRATGRAYNVWTAGEEDALRAGVRRHGVGAWETIRQDEEYPALRKRSGVQLKDKWRNLVKFRKLGEEELRGLPSRTGGPWSRRGSMRHELQGDGVGAERNVSATFQVEETIARVQRTCNANCVADKNGHDASEKQRRSVRSCARGPHRFDEFFTDFDGVDGEGWGKRKVPRGHHRAQECRKLAPRAEDRRYGIYDVRRYSYHSMPNNAGRNDDRKLEMVAGGKEEEESFVVDCPCGVTYDDGQMMIECELCKAWAHIRCLKERMGRFRSPSDQDSQTYLCHKCQARRPMTPHSPNTTTQEHPFKTAEVEGGHPLAGFKVPRKKRLQRRPRLDVRSWCSWMRPLMTSSCGKRDRRSRFMAEESPWVQCEEFGPGFGVGAFPGMGFGGFGAQCGYGGVEMLHAQLMAAREQLRFLPQNLAALALYTQALQSTTPDSQLLMPERQCQSFLPQAMAAHLAHQMGLLRTGSPCTTPHGLIAGPPVPKKLKREGSGVPDCGFDFQREGFQGSCAGGFKHKAKA